MSRKAVRPEAIDSRQKRKEGAVQLAAFMLKYKLDIRGISMLFNTLSQTIRKWENGDNVPPAILAVLLNVLDKSPEARQVIGLARHRNPNISRAQPPVKNQVHPPRRKAAAPSAPAPERRFDPELFAEGPMDMWTVNIEEEAGTP